MCSRPCPTSTSRNHMEYTGKKNSEGKGHGQGTEKYADGGKCTGERAGAPSSNYAEVWCMQKQLGYLSLSVLLMFLLYGCGRDLSTPSRRLVGHWRSTTGIEAEYFISEIDSKTGQGTITEYNSLDGTVYIGKYRIRDEQPKGNKVAIIATWPEGAQNQIEFSVAEDGSGGTMHKFYIKYVDGKTEP